MADRFGLGVTNCRRASNVVQTVVEAEALGAEIAFIAEDINCRDAFQLAGPSVESSLAASVARLCDAVGQSREITVSDEGLERWAECFTTIQAFEIWRSLGGWVERTRPELGPGIRERICDESGKVRRFVNIFANDEDIRFLKNLETPIKDSDEVSIVPAIAGG